MSEDNRMQFGQDEYDDADEHRDDAQDGGSDDNHDSESPEAVDDNKDDKDFPENQDDESQHEQPKKSEGAKERINKLTRERYRAAREAARARDEVEYWKSKYAEEHEAKKVTTEAGVRQYEANVAARMEKARSAQVAAIESGDAQAQADANMELASATTEMHELNNWKHQHEHQKRLQEQNQYYEQQPFVPQQNYNADIAQDWLEDNEWFHPQSPRHDKELANYINWFSNNLDEEMVRAGKGALIRSPEYFECIDAYKNEFINHRRSQGQNNTQRRDLNMRVERGRGPAPVRGAQGVYGGRRGGSDPTGLSREEREAASWFNISQEAYRKGKEEDIKDNSHKRGGY